MHDIQKNLLAIGITIITLYAHTLVKTNGVLLLIMLRKRNPQSGCFQTHAISLDNAQKHKCLWTGDTKNTQVHTHAPKLTQESHSPHFRRNKWRLFILSPQHTDTLTHAANAPSTVTQTDLTYANTKTCCVLSKETTASY